MNKSSKGTTVLGEVSRKEIDKSIRMIRQYCDDEEDCYECPLCSHIYNGIPHCMFSGIPHHWRTHEELNK